MPRVRQPKFIITYNGKDITVDITKYILSVEYNDKAIGESDELSLSLEDVDAIWRNEWYPKKGDRLGLEFGYDDMTVDAGLFSIDELNLSGPPDVVTIKGLATWVTSAMRTKVSKGYEGQTLRQIAQHIAQKNGLTLDDGSYDNSSSSVVSVKSERDFIQYEINAIKRAEEQTNPGVLGGTLSAVALNILTISDSLSGKGYVDEAEALRLASLKLSAAASSEDRAGRIINIYVAMVLLVKVGGSLKNKTIFKAATYNGELITIRIGRSTQNRETDLAYLKRLGDEYGFMFSVKGAKLVARSIFEIEKGRPVYLLDRTDIAQYEFTDTTNSTVKSAHVSHHNPLDGKTVKQSFNLGDKDVKALFSFNGVSDDDAGLSKIIGGSTDAVQEDLDKYLSELPTDSMNEFDSSFMDVAEDSVEIRTKSENESQANRKAKVAIYKTKAQQVSGSITVEGNPLLIAGNNFLLTGMGQYSGKYHIIESRQSFSRDGGYTTVLNIKRVGYIDKKKHKSGKKRKVNYDTVVVS